MKKGYIQIYTGNGKGKTTAAFGLALRAVGAGLKVYIAQFVKGMEYSELNSISKIENITLEQFGRNCFIKNEPEQEDIDIAQLGFKKVCNVVNNENYDVIICDEINIALYYKLISLKDVMNLIKNKPDPVELILTGRKMPTELIELADLVTEMKEIKHYYNNGVQARKGIES